MRILKRAAGIFFILLGILLFLQTVRTLTLKDRRMDLGLVTEAALRLTAGGPLYIDSEYLPHTKSPLATLGFVPFGRIPVWWLDRIWDGLVLFGFVLLFRWLWRQIVEVSADTQVVRTVLVCVFFSTFNAMNTELAYGQFNLLMLLTVLATVSTRPMGAFLGGAGYLFSILLKPTQIVFLPWVWRYTLFRRQVVVGALGTVAVLLVVYGWGFGWERLILDHRVWWTKTSIATGYHLGRPDNYGLPSFFASTGFPPQYWIVFQVFAVALAFWITYLAKERLNALAAVGVLATVFSPMAWLHTYVLTIPFVTVLWLRLVSLDPTSPAQKACLVLAVASYYWGTEIYNPFFVKIQTLNACFPNRPPLWGVMAAVVCWWISNTCAKKRSLGP